LVLEAVLLILLGVAVAAFGTMVGAGGGFILVPILLIAYPEKSAGTVAAMSLFVVLVNALSGAGAYAHARRIDFYSGAWFVAATFPGAVAGALVVGRIPRDAFQGMFAVVLLAVAAYLVLRRAPTAIREPVQGWSVVSRLVRDRRGHTFAYSYKLWQGLVISLGVGFMSSLLGIGGGIVHVPAMVALLHFPVHIAVATSTFVLTFIALEGTTVHFAAGHLGFDETLGRAALIAIGALPGAQLGARLAHHLPGEVIIRALAISLLLVAARLAYSALT
jgi:uncharacterized membrane protein YfcA